MLRGSVRKYWISEHLSALQMSRLLWNISHLLHLRDSCLLNWDCAFICDTSVKSKWLEADVLRSRCEFSPFLPQLWIIYKHIVLTSLHHWLYIRSSLWFRLPSVSCDVLQCCDKYLSPSLSAIGFSTAKLVLLSNTMGLWKHLPWICKYPHWRIFILRLRNGKDCGNYERRNEWLWCDWTTWTSFCASKLPPARSISVSRSSAVWKAIKRLIFVQIPRKHNNRQPVRSVYKTPGLLRLKSTKAEINIIQ